MIFTKLTESGEIVFKEYSCFNESDNYNKNREKVLKDVIKLFKSTLNPTIKKHTDFKIIEDGNDKDDFLNGRNDVVYIAHINAWDIVPNARADFDAVTEWNNILYDNCKSVNKKLPKGFSINCDGGDWDDWLVKLVCSKK